jgi:hypothetical protein
MFRPFSMVGMGPTGILGTPRQSDQAYCETFGERPLNTARILKLARLAAGIKAVKV